MGPRNGSRTVGDDSEKDGARKAQQQVEQLRSADTGNTKQNRIEQEPPALGAEHRRSVPTNQRQFRSRPASIDAGTVTWVHRKPFWKGVSASKVEERRPPITDSSV